MILVRVLTGWSSQILLPEESFIDLRRWETNGRRRYFQPHKCTGPTTTNGSDQRESKLVVGLWVTYLIDPISSYGSQVYQKDVNSDKGVKGSIQLSIRRTGWGFTEISSIVTREKLRSKRSYPRGKPVSKQKDRDIT